MSNNLIPASAREIFVSDTGNDANDGRSLQFPLGTLAAAVLQATALTPPLSTTSPAAIIDIGASTFAENLVLPDDVFVDLRTVRLLGPGGTVITAGANARGNYSTVQTSSTSGDIAFDSNSKSRLGFNSPSIVLNGSNQFGILASGTTGQLYSQISQFLSIFSGNVLYDWQASGAPGSLTVDEFLVFGTNTTCVRLNTSHTMPLDVRAGKITAGGAGNVGLDIVSGSADVSISYIEAPTAIHVKAGGTLNVSEPQVIGDVIVDQSGELNGGLSSLNGNLTVNGTFTGNIFQTQITGDLTIGDSGEFEGIISRVTGTTNISSVAVQAGNVNGVINGVAYGTYRNLSYDYDFARSGTLNNGAFLRSDNVQGNPFLGPVALGDLVPDVLGWSNQRADAGVFEIWSDGVRFATADKPLGLTGTADVVLDAPGTFISRDSTISVRFVATIPGGSLRNINVNISARRHA